MKLALFQVGDIWHYRFSLNGRRISRSTRETVRRRAQQIAAEAFEAAKLRDRGREPVPTLVQLGELWLAAKAPAVSDAHVRGMRVVLTYHLGELAGMSIDEIETSHIESARNAYLADHQRSSTNEWARLIRVLFGFALERKMIRYIAWRLKPLKVQQKVRPILSPALIQPFVAAIDEADQRGVISTAVRLMLAFGLREAECRTAKWEWFDWSRETYTPGITKGREAVPLRAPVWLLDFLSPVRQSCGLVISRPNSFELPPKFTSRAIQAAGERIGIVRLTPHRLRATFATIALESGTSINELKCILRHRDIRTSAGYVQRMSEGAAAPNARMFDHMGFPAGNPKQPEKPVAAGEKPAMALFLETTGKAERDFNE